MVDSDGKVSGRERPVGHPRTRMFLTMLLTIGAPGQAALAENLYQNLLTPLLQTGETSIGQPIVYPQGTPNITAALVTMPPGRETGWHIHAVPLFAYVLEGELTVDYGEKGKKVYKAGQALVEALGTAHNGKNTGQVPMRLLAFYAGEKGKPNTEKVAGPAP